nr:hypothetical protein [Tanacetum cinerariifolium]
MHKDYLLRGSYHGNNSIFILNCHGVRWQVQLRRVGPDKVAVIRPAWSNFVRRNVGQDVRLLYFVKEGHDTFYVATYNKYGLETMLTKKQVLSFGVVYLEKRVYPPSGSQTVDLVLNNRKYKVLVGNVPLENSRNIFEMYIYRDEWWNMMEELDFQPGHVFTFTLLRKGLFLLTVFNELGEAVMESETYSSYVLRNAFFYLGRKPAG